MALFRLQVTPIGRTAGRRAVASAAYRAGERLRDERTGELYNYSRRKDVLHKEIFLPTQVDANAMPWARDRGSLWNAAEQAEKRSNSRVAREYQVSLPEELPPAQRLALAVRFSRELADRYGVAVDLAIHGPRPGGDPRNTHAHLLTTTREVTPTGLGAKTGLDMQDAVRAQRGLPSYRDELIGIRERWASLTNDALRVANIDARVDHRSLEAQGIDRVPVPHIPMEAYRMEKSGLRSDLAERLREDYRARVAARLERDAERARIEQAAPPDMQRISGSKGVAEIQRQAVAAWLRFRQQEAEKGADKAASRSPDREAGPGGEKRRDSQREFENPATDEPAVTRGRENDFGL